MIENIKCDKCNEDIKIFKNTYCEDCLQDKDYEIEELKDRIKELKLDIEKLATGINP